MRPLLFLHSPAPPKNPLLTPYSQKSSDTQAKRGGQPLRVSYTISMSKDVSFQLDPKGGEDVLTQMAMPVIKQSAEAIAARANSMAGSMSSDPPEITVSTQFGTIKRGVRAIATIRADGNGDPHKGYIGTTALSKAKDAGRV